MLQQISGHNRRFISYNEAKANNIKGFYIENSFSCDNKTLISVGVSTLG